MEGTVGLLINRMSCREPAVCINESLLLGLHYRTPVR